jgi:hypothetical protein
MMVSFRMAQRAERMAQSASNSPFAALNLLCYSDNDVPAKVARAFIKILKRRRIAASNDKSFLGKTIMGKTIKSFCP